MTTQMQRVMGLIVGLPATRLAIITRRVNGVCIATTTSLTLNGKQGETLEGQRLRVTQMANEIVHAIGYPVLVVVQPRSNSVATGLWPHLVLSLLDAGIPAATFESAQRPQSPATDLAGVITPLWPETRLSAPQEATALALAHLGALRLGWDVPTLRGEGLAAALGTPAWPDALPTPVHPDPPVV